MFLKSLLIFTFLIFSVSTCFISKTYLSGKGVSSASVNGDGFNFDYQLGQTIAGASDTLTLCAKGASNGDDVLGSIKWYDVT